VTPQPFAWDEAIGFGLGVLRLSSDAFWRMTPRELARAVEAVNGRMPVHFDRATLTQMMTRYPDGRRDHRRR
jgi:uncharacterized phage protein (TIGR02216 family)